MDYEKLYKELWCAVWCCPLDEYEEDESTHKEALEEVSRVNDAAAKWKHLTKKDAHRREYIRGKRDGEKAGSDLTKLIGMAIILASMLLLILIILS